MVVNLQDFLPVGEVKEILGSPLLLGLLPPFRLLFARGRAPLN